MKLADVRAYLERDWSSVRELKERYWAQAKRALTPEQAMRVGDGLRQQVRTLRPDWPDDEQREADLSVHVRVS